MIVCYQFKVMDSRNRGSVVYIFAKNLDDLFTKISTSFDTVIMFIASWKIKEK